MSRLIEIQYAFLLLLSVTVWADGVGQVDVTLTDPNHIYGPGDQAQIVISPTNNIAIEQVRACVGGVCAPLESLQSGGPGQAATGLMRIPQVAGFPKNVILEISGSGGFYTTMQADLKISNQVKVATGGPTLSKVEVHEDLLNPHLLKVSYDVVSPNGQAMKAASVRVADGDDSAIAVTCENSHCSGTIPRTGPALVPNPTVELSVFDQAGRVAQTSVKAKASRDLSKSPIPIAQAFQSQGCDEKSLKFTFQTNASQLDTTNSSLHLKAALPSSGPLSVPQLTDVTSGDIACDPSTNVCTASMTLPKSVVSPVKNLVLDLAGKDGTQKEVDLLSSDPSHGDLTDQLSNCLGNLQVGGGSMLSKVALTPVQISHSGNETANPAVNP